MKWRIRESPQIDKTNFSNSGLHLQVPGDDEGPPDNSRRRRARPVSPRALRHRSWLLPLHKAQA
jgi:hypothetical protein